VPVRTPRPARAGRLAALLAIATLAVAACAGGTATAPSPTPTLGPTQPPSANPYAGATAGSGTGIKLGYLSYGDLVPYVKQISDGIAVQAASAGVDLVTCDANVDPAKVDGCMKQLTAAGIKGLIGKGSRSAEVRTALVEHQAIYFAATGGAGALLARKIKSAEVVAWEDLGAEAVRRLVFENFPLVVINDVFGNDLYEEGAARYRVEN